MANDPESGDERDMTNSQPDNDPKMPCPRCGRPNPVSMIYCDNEDCIAELHPEKATCIWCLARLPGNSKFCRECGRATGREGRAHFAISRIVKKIKEAFSGRPGQPR